MTMLTVVRRMQTTVIYDKINFKDFNEIWPIYFKASLLYLYEISAKPDRQVCRFTFAVFRLTSHVLRAHDLSCRRGLVCFHRLRCYRHCFHPMNHPKMRASRFLLVL